MVTVAFQGLGVFDPDSTIEEILRRKKASITRAPLPSDAPSWDEIRHLTWRDIDEGARRDLPGFRTICKLLTDRRFDR